MKAIKVLVLCMLFSASFIVNGQVVFSITDSPATCFAIADGSLTATVSSGNPPYTYELFDDQMGLLDSYSTATNNYTFSNLSPGSYYIRVTDVNTANQILPITLGPDEIIVTISVSQDVSCFGGSDLQLQVDATGGIPPYVSYEWSSTFNAYSHNGQITTDLGEDEYFVNITDNNGCIAQSSTFSYFPSVPETDDYTTGPVEIVIPTVTPNASCGALNNGSIEVTGVSGGTPDFGTYTITGYGYAVVVAGNPQPTTFQENNLLTGLAAGDYDVWVQDGNLCTKQYASTVTVSTTLAPTPDAGSDALICASDSYFLATANAVNYSTLIWTSSGDGVFDVDSILNPTYTPDGTDITNGTVTLTLTAYGNAPCADAVDNMTLTINPQPAPLAGSDQTVCGLSASVGDAATSNGGSILWTQSSGPGSASYDNNTLINPIITVTQAGTYTFQLEESYMGCSGTDVVTITFETPPTAYAGADGMICEGDTYTLAGATAENYSMVLWITSGDGVFNMDQILNPTYTPGGTDKTNGTVTLTLTVSGNAPCADAANSMTLTINPSPLPTFVAEEPFVCLNSEGTYSTEVGQSNYSWSVNGGTIASGGTASDASAVVNWTSLGAQSIQVSYEDVNGCASSPTVSNVTVYDLPTPDLSINTTSTCTNQSLVLDGNPLGGTGNYTNDLWTGNVNPKNTQSTTFLSATPGNEMVTYTITDENGCTGSDNIFITVLEPPTVFAGLDTTLCYGSIFQVVGATVANADSYSWAAPNGDGSFDDTYVLNPTYTPGFSDLSNGFVELVLTGTNAMCGDNLDTITITYPPELESQISAPSYFTIQPTTEISVTIWAYHENITELGLYLRAPDGESTLKLYNHMIDGGTCFLPNPQTLDSLVFSSASSTALDFCNFTGDVSGTFQAPDGWTMFTGMDPAQGGWKLVVEDSKFSKTGNLFKVQITFTDDVGGTPTTVVYSTSNMNSSDPNSVIIDGGTTIYSIPIQLNAECYNSNDVVATASAIGGTPPYTYEWSNGELTAANTTLDIAKHYLTVTDALGCVAYDSVEVSGPDTVFVSLDSVLNVSCKHANSGYLAASAFGGSGAPFTFEWTKDGNPISHTMEGDSKSNISALLAGEYVVKVFDVKGCMSADTFIISEPAIDITIESYNLVESTYGMADGSATVNLLLGSGTPFTIAEPYMYEWTNMDAEIISTTNTLADAKAGFYSIQITDSVGCSIIDTVEITFVPIECEAKFSFAQVADTVFFTDLSSNNTGTYHWDFGDGDTAIVANPYHVYKNPGSYIVTLNTLDTTALCSSTFSDTLDLKFNYLAPKASFTYSTSDLSVLFENTSVIYTDTASYIWNFGDGKTSKAFETTHTYAGDGVYTACLTVIDNEGKSNSFCQPILVGDTTQTYCIADFSYEIINQQVVFTNLSSDNTTNYYWDFGDGQYSALENPTHNFEDGGYYVVTLTAEDSANNCMDYIFKYLYVEGADSYCMADFTHQVENNAVTFLSTSQGEITDYLWDFGDGKYSVDSVPTHTYATEGIYTVCLTIYSEATGCMNEVCYDVFVTDAETAICQADFTYMINDLEVEYYSNAMGNPTDFFWDFGDGQYSTAKHVNHTYNKAGYYGVELTIYNDTSECLDTYLDVVFVIDTAQVFCQAGYDYYTENKLVSFKDESKGAVTDYFWDFGDGTYSTAKAPTHSYSEPGYFEVIQTVYNSETDCLDEYWDVVVVIDTTQAMCKADFTYYPQGSAVSFTSKAIGDYKQIFWDFDDGTNSNDKNPVHNFEKPGYYNIAFTVIDTNTTCFDTKFKVIYVEGDVAEPTATGPVKADYNTYVKADSLKAKFTDLSLGTINKWYWDFGDNTAASTVANPVHFYETNDYYRACLTVSNDVSINTKCKFIPVGDVSTKNTAFFTYYADTVYSTAYFKNKSLGDIVSYAWDFGDGYTSDQKNPSHTYADTGYYAVCLSTTSSVGRVRTYCKDVRIGNAISDPCLFSCVWPGDANNDLEANHYDILTIGLNYGMEGPYREDASMKWYGQYAQNWSNYQLDGTNNKHGDSNGDGIINAEDTIAVDQNFAFSHYFTPDVKAQEWEITMEWIEESTKAVGSKHSARAILSRPTGKSEGELYGIGYEIELKKGAGIIWDSISVSFEDCWLGDVTDDLLAYYNTDEEKQMIFVATVKNDQVNAVGEGTVAVVNFYLEEGYSPYDVSFNVTTLGGILLDGSRVGVGGSIALNIGDDKAFCTGESLTLEAPEGYETYLWSTGATERTLSVNQGGEYWCEVTDSTGGTARDTLMITENPLPEIDLGTNISGEGEVELDAGAGYESYLWNTDETTPSITVNESGEYWVQVSSAQGCTSIDTVNVTITGINENLLSNDQLKVYPNPNNGSFWLIVDDAFTGAMSYQLLDISGKVLTTNEHSIDGKYKELIKVDLSQGVYYLRVQINDKHTVKRVVIQ